MPRGKDPIWEYATDEGKKVRCNFCQETFVGGITRIKYHLAKITCNDVKACPAVIDDVCDIAKNAVGIIGSKRQKISNVIGKSLSSSSSSLAPQHGVNAQCEQDLGSLGHRQKTIFSMVKKKEKEIADIALVKAMIANNIAFNVLRNEEFQMACVKIANHGSGYVPPSSETARTKILACLKEEANEYVKSIKESWVVSGCTLMSDSWTDGRKRPHINLLAACPKGVIFLKSKCTVGNKKTADYIANFISSGIEEVGPQNVVQFVSDNASNYLCAGYLIEQKYPHISKTSCAAHCLDLMLEDIDGLSHVKPILEDARKIVKFLYRYQHVLDLMRAHTNGRELKRPGMTRFATQFICLQGILKEEEKLRFMVASNEWRNMPPCKSEEGKEVTNIIQGNVFWTRGNEITTVIEPLVRILRMADGDGSTIGYLYEAINRAKESIKAYYKENIENFLPFWKIIDDRWVKNLHCDLYLAAAILNPCLFYPKQVSMNKETKPALERIIQKMVPNAEDRKIIVSELLQYVARNPNIFTEFAINSLHDAHPRIWWELFGAEIPTLQRLAIKILSQPCSASACERNWSAFEAAHTKKRNRLEPKKLHDLVYVRMNLHMKKTSQNKEMRDTSPISIENIHAFPVTRENDFVVTDEPSENSGDSSSSDSRDEGFEQGDNNDFQLLLD